MGWPSQHLGNLDCTVLLFLLMLSGPKRFDVIDGRWRYSHDGVALHDLLQEEFGRLLGVELDLQTLPHAHLISDEGNWA